MKKDRRMRGTLSQERTPRIHTTLLDLLQALNAVTREPHLVVATAVHLLNSRNARLAGSAGDKRLIIGRAGPLPSQGLST